MKQFVSIFMTLLFTGALQAEEVKTIKLNTPDKTRGKALMQALADRHSDREFSTRELSLQDLSDLLWAANGINRQDGKRTAPSALNKQEVDIYVIRKDGAYLYRADTHSLQLIATGDHRTAVAGAQSFAAEAPVSLVLVADISRFGDDSERTRTMAAVDAGIVCQNINLFCAAVGLSTVPRASMDHATLRKVLKLKESQLLLMNNPVGYPKK